MSCHEACFVSDKLSRKMSWVRNTKIIVGRVHEHARENHRAEELERIRLRMNKLKDVVGLPYAFALPPLKK